MFDSNLGPLTKQNVCVKLYVKYVKSILECSIDPAHHPTLIPDSCMAKSFIRLFVEGRVCPERFCRITIPRDNFFYLLPIYPRECKVVWGDSSQCGNDKVLLAISLVCERARASTCVLPCH